MTASRLGILVAVLVVLVGCTQRPSGGGAGGTGVTPGAGSALPPATGGGRGAEGGGY